MKTISRTARAARGLVVFSLAASGALALAPDAAAQGPVPSTLARCPDGQAPKDPEAARVSFRAGQTAFSEGAYARSVELWEQAYRDDCTAHALLLNLAMAQELLGRPQDAIRTLRLFDSRSPGSPYVEANAKRIQRLERSAGEQERLRSGREQALWTPVARPAAHEDALKVPLPLVVSVAGGAVAVVGAVLFFEGRASASSAEDRCGAAREACTNSQSLADGERARARAQVGGWMAGAGAATLAGGLVWHLVTSPSRPLDQSAAGSGVAFGADLPTRAAQLTWSGSF
jgi:tetratricopeptide (TPR) repeat protein